MKTTLAIVSLCVNDEHGFGTGHVSSAHFSSCERGYDTMPVLELESPWADDDEADESPHLQFVAGDHGILIDTEIFPTVGSRSYVGNVHWNSYAMLLETALRLAAFLIERQWSIDAANADQPFLPAELL